MMLQFHDKYDVARDVVRTIAAQDVDSIATRTATATETQQRTSTDVDSTRRAADTTSMTPTQDSNTASTQNAWPWHRGWTASGNPWTGQWGGMHTTIVTLASTVTYTEPPSRAEPSQTSPVIPKPAEDRMEGMDISGPVAAGIGIGASVGLLGLCLVVAYLLRRCSRYKRLSSSQKSEVIKAADGIWPTYPYPASNEAPIELSALRPPKELDGATKYRQQGLSCNSGLVELDGDGSKTSRSRSRDDAIRGI